MFTKIGLLMSVGLQTSKMLIKILHRSIMTLEKRVNLEKFQNGDFVPDSISIISFEIKRVIDAEK